MSKLLLNLDSPPNRMSSSQLFESQNHLNNWLEEVSDIITNPVINGGLFTSDQTTGTIEEKPQDYFN